MKRNSDDPIISTFKMNGRPQKLRYDKFVSLYMLSGNAAESFKKVFPNTSDKNVKKSCYRILNHRYVIYELNRRNKEINKKMDKKIIMNRERILTELESILELTKGKEQYPAALKALDQLARVTGAYAPEKSEVEHKGITINYIQPSDEVDEFKDECPNCDDGVCICDTDIEI